MKFDKAIDHKIVVSLILPIVYICVGVFTLININKIDSDYSIKLM